MITESPDINNRMLNTPVVAPIQHPATQSNTDQPNTAQSNATKSNATLNPTTLNPATLNPATPSNARPKSKVLEENTASNLGAVNHTLEEQDEDQSSSALSSEKLDELLDEINKTMYSMNKLLKFEVNDKTEDLVVRVINTDTDQVIRQYPSEEVLKRKEQLLAGELTEFSVQVD